MKNLFKAFLFTFLLIQFSSCTQDALLNDNTIEKASGTSLSKEEAITKFSEILSKATYNEPALRAFLKDQALMMKDNDHNVFYPLTKNEIVSENKTFSQILEKYAGNKQVLNDIERSFPLINIFIPDLTVFDKELSVENLDTKDRTVPIFSTGKFYVNGIVVDSISEDNAGQLPLFHSFVVNESFRRVIKPGTRSSSDVQYDFADDAYNPEKVSLNHPYTRVREEWSELTENLPELYKADIPYVNVNEFPSETLNTFYKVGAGMGTLRPMIYYNLNNITEFNSPNATLDVNVKDVIYRMKIGREYYDELTKYKDKDFISPYLQTNIEWKRYTEKYSNTSYYDLTKYFWTSGSFVFKMNVSTGTYNQLITLVLKPQDIFTLTFKRGYKHHTWFTDAVTRWFVEIDKIQSKWIYPHKLGIDTRFSPWNPKSDSYIRSIFVSIAGSNITDVREKLVTVVKMDKKSVSAGLNIPITMGGEGKDSKTANLNISGAWESQNTTTTQEKVTISVTDKDREMGNNYFNFFGSSPIIQVYNNNVYLETTRYGCFDMCIIPVKRNLAQ